MVYLPVEQRRQQLVEATINLLAREGIQASSVRRIAEEAGVPLGTMNYCFGSKRALLAEVIQVLNAEPLEGVLDSVEPGQTAAQAFRAALRAAWRIVEQAPDHQLLSYELNAHALRDPQLAGLAQEQHERYLATLAGLLSTAAERIGAVWTVPVQDMARMVAAVTTGVTLAWLNDRDSRAALAALDSFAVQFGGFATTRRGKRAG